MGYKAGCMRKRDILGSFVKEPGVLYEYYIKKVAGEPAAYSALITYLPGSRDICFDKDGKEFRIAGEGYKQLRYLPLNEDWCLITFYSPANELLQWYFDISKGSGLDENGMPWYDDVYLDLVITPDNNVQTIDEDELLEAFKNNEITEDEYYRAFGVRDKIISSKWGNVGFLKDFSEKLLSDYVE
jgi:hypothetical protein